MHIKSVELCSDESNFVVLKVPGRQYPGCLIQGDSLAISCDTAKCLASAAAEGDLGNEDSLSDLQELTNALLYRIIHYQNVLDEHGITAPYGRRYSEDDLVELVPERDDE